MIDRSGRAVYHLEVDQLASAESLDSALDARRRAMTRARRCLLVALAVLAVLVPASLAATPNWTVVGIQTELMCPTCKGERLDISTAPAANRVRAYLAPCTRAGLVEGPRQDARSSRSSGRRCWRRRRAPDSGSSPGSRRSPR